MPVFDWKFSQTCSLNVGLRRQGTNNNSPLQDAPPPNDDNPPPNTYNPPPNDDNPPPNTYNPPPNDDNPPPNDDNPKSPQNLVSKEDEPQQRPPASAPLMDYTYHFKGKYGLEHNQLLKNPENSKNGSPTTPKSTHTPAEAIQMHNTSRLRLPTNSKTVPGSSNTLKPIGTGTTNGRFFRAMSGPGPHKLQTALKRPVPLESLCKNLSNQLAEPKKPKLVSSLTDDMDDFTNGNEKGKDTTVDDVDLPSLSNSSNYAEFIISDPNVTTLPPLAVINDKIKKTGDYNVMHLSVRHKEHGRVDFLGNRNLSSLVPGADLSDFITFKHGVIEVDDCMKTYPMMITLHNITSAHFAEIRGTDSVNIKELQEIVETLGSLYNASYICYNLRQETWTFLLLGCGQSMDDNTYVVED